MLSPGKSLDVTEEVTSRDPISKQGKEKKEVAFL